MEKGATQQNAVSGFRKSSIYPFDFSKVNIDRLAPSKTFSRAETVVIQPDNPGALLVLEAVMSEEVKSLYKR